MAFYRSTRRRYTRRPAAYSRRRRYGGTPSYYRAKPRRTYRRKVTRRKTSSAMRSGGGCACPDDPGLKFLIANADPFEPRAIGCKIPDSNTVPSVASPQQELTALALTAAGTSKAWVFNPTLTSSILSSTEGAGSWTWPALFTGTTSWSKRADFAATFELFRPVAHGVRISCANAPTSTTGFVHVAVAYEAYNGVTTWPFPTNVSGLSGYPWYKRVTLASLTQSPLTIINKYVDETAFRYNGADTGGISSADPMEFHVPFGWGSIIIAVEGSSTITPLEVESMLHTECIPKFSGVIMGSTAAPYTPSLLGATAHMVSNTEFTHTESNQNEHFSSSIAAAIGAGAQQAGNVALNQVLKPMAMRAGYNLAGHAISYGLAGIASLSAGIAGVNSNAERLSLTR